MDASARYSVRRTSTLDVAEGERAEFWAEHVRANHCRMDYRFSRSGGFRGRTAVQRGGGYQIVEFRSDAIGYLRSPRLLSRDPDEEVRLVLPLRGAVGVQVGDTATTVRRGSAGLLAPDEPFGIDHDVDLHALIFTLPLAELPRARAGRIDVTSGLGPVFAGLLGRAATQRDQLTAPQFETVCRQAVELLQLLTAPDVPPAGRAVVEQAFRAHVARTADDPLLTGAAVAAALGWSLRQVQVALQDAGATPSEVIRAQRLRNAHRRLLDPSLHHATVADIAFASGFSSTSAFADAFRRHYGSAPGELRRGRG